MFLQYNKRLMKINARILHITDISQVFHREREREREGEKERATKCPEFSWLARKKYTRPEARNYVSKPGFPKFSQNFLIIYAYIYHFEPIFCLRTGKITTEILYFGVKCKFLREVLFVAGKNYFGNVVILAFIQDFSSNSA